MADIQPTEVPDSPAFDAAGPAVTAPATLYQRDLFGRQNNYGSCGYYSLLRSDWATWKCGEENAWTTTCKTIGSHFGCFENIFTTCYPRASICDSADPRALCCTGDVNVNYPNCVTGIKALEDGDELSIYLCGRNEQQVPFYESTVIKVTTGSTTGEQTLTSIDTTHGVTIVTKTAEPSPEPSNPTPVGAIIGGVICGVALIAILGLAVWFLRSKKLQGKEVTPAPAAAPIVPPQQYQQQMYQQDVPSPVVYDHNNNYAVYPTQGGSPPPPSDPRYSQMFLEGTGSPHQSPPIEPYKTVASPVSELPIALSPHGNTPVSELPAGVGNLNQLRGN
ncbi:hypothetical protein FCOIX_9738 [Fusarium coicis]|nr:hypothetical protein FCOIX_9738 [Fusarium coicis]